MLDEADQMLDLGFLPPIRRIVSHLTAKRQNLFFSATLPSEIGKLADELLRDPARISAARTGTTVDSVMQRVIYVESHNKRAVLVELFRDPQMARTLVFTRTKRGADRVARHLEAAGIRVAAIHGNKSQSQREHALASFRASKIRVLVATDIAARGIDVELVTHVVNFELPEVPENYVHRIGRTARAGATGVAISLCDGEERDLLRNIERLTRQSISAEDRRGKGDRASDRPVQRERNGRVGDDRRAHARGRQRGAPRNRQRHGHRGSDTGHYSSAAGPRGRQHQGRKQGFSWAESH